MKSKKRILMILFNDFMMDTRVKSEASALKDDHEVFILCKSGVYGMDDRPTYEKAEVENKMYEIYRYPYRSNLRYESAAQYMLGYLHLAIITLFMGLYIIIKKRINVLHIHNPPDIYLPIILAARAFGVIYVFDIHDPVPELYSTVFPNGAMQRLWVSIEGLNVKLANSVIVINGSSKTAVMERHNVPESKIFIVRNGPKLEMTKIPQKKKSESSKIRLGYVGNINLQDGVEFLVRAYDDLKKEQENIELLIVGDGRSLEPVKQIVKKNKIQDVTFTGFIIDKSILYGYIASIDIGVSPDERTPLNEMGTFIKVLEFMAFGKPIIATDLPENHVSAGDAAVYFKAGSAEDFVEKSKELIGNRTKMKRMGKLGKKRIEEKLSWEHSIPHLKDAYEHLDSND